MKRKRTRAKSYVDVYLEEKGLLHKIGNKRWNEFLDEVYVTLKEENGGHDFKLKKCYSQGDLVKINNVTVTKTEGKLVFNGQKNSRRPEESYYNNGYLQSIAHASHSQEERRGEIKNEGRNNLFQNLRNNSREEQRVDLIRGGLNIGREINVGRENVDQKERRPEEPYYSNGYLQSVAHSLRPRTCSPPYSPVEIPGRPVSCDPKSPFHFPPLKPKMQRRELDLRIHAVIGLLKLRRIQK